VLGRQRVQNQRHHRGAAAAARGALRGARELPEDVRRHQAPGQVLQAAQHGAGQRARGLVRARACRVAAAG